MKPFQKYAADGYYVARGAIDLTHITALADAFYSDAKPSKTPLPRQNGKSEPTTLNENGFMTQVLLDPHVHGGKELDRFKNAVIDVACGQAMLSALSEITLTPEHSLQQLMVFEQSATPAHQDWLYLDTFPPGHLTAAWIAIEDIDPSATRFFIIPGSQDFAEQFDNTAVNESSRYVEYMTGIVEQRYAGSIQIPQMKAGDVLFWNSRLIHGSRRGTDPTKSRLSLTAHYIPKGFGYGNRLHPVQQNYPFPLMKNGRPIPHLDRAIIA